jgi:hypothetical protein
MQTAGDVLLDAGSGDVHDSGELRITYSSTVNFHRTSFLGGMAGERRGDGTGATTPSGRGLTQRYIYAPQHRYRKVLYTANGAMIVGNDVRTAYRNIIPQRTPGQFNLTYA